jgi:porin
VRGQIRAIVLAVLALGLQGLPARADDDDRPRSNSLPQSRSPEVNAKRAIGDDEAEGPTIIEGIPALNPIDAMRDTLRDTYGVYLHGAYLGDPYGNLSGGLKRGTTYSGRLDVELDVDTGKVAGLKGGTLHANMFQIAGSDLSKNFVGNILSINDIAARPTTRLYELWYEQKFGDALSIRAGQIGIDVEFLTSDYAASFVNATFGWPGLPSVDLPQGGPAYPLATPAVRIKFNPTKALSILGAVFDGVPAGPGDGDPQARDRYGLNFRVSDPPLFFLEAQYRYNQGPDAHGLPGTLKLGAFAHEGRFDDERFGNDGLPLATGVGVPLTHRGNGGGYAILDQQIYRLPGDDPEKGIGVFARAIGAPSDRNLVDLYLDAGISTLGMIPGRPADFFGVAAAFARISPAARAADAATDVVSGVAAPLRSFEAVVEVSYSAQIVPGLAVQPTFQYVVHPGGGIVDPGSETAIRDAKVFGVTTTVRF